MRRYHDRSVPRELIEQVLEAARWAPSPHGRQPWRFAVLTRPELRAHLADAMGDEWRRQLAMDGQDAATIEAGRSDLPCPRRGVAFGCQWGCMGRSP